MNSLICALEINEFNRISCCQSAKEIWDKLEVTHEGTNQVKEDRIDLLMGQYEGFKMKPEENICSMFVRFTNIINDLHSLEKVFSNYDKARKILRALPKSFHAKRTVMIDSKRIKNISMDKLQGTLLAYELELKVLDDEEESAKPTKNLALQVSKGK